MKQHITLDQWKELTEAEQERYIKETETPLGVPIWESVTIGHMLEFLDWNLQFPKIIIEDEECCDHCPTRYRLEFYIDPKEKSPGTHGMKRWSVARDELADALWEACKEVLCA